MKNLVIGLGEVGKAIQEILNCEGYDISMKDYAWPTTVDTIHICFPYSANFIERVKLYKEVTEARIVVVHSTVPVGTCDPNGWVHSPVRGVHPNMVEGLKTFVKYFGGKGAREASIEWTKLGINVRSSEKAADMEALKLWDTTQYGMMILLEKQIFAYCLEHGLNFDLVYTDANRTYDIGYKELNRPEVCRPYLKHISGPIGGHCVVENCDLLDHPIAGQIKTFNTLLKSGQEE